MRATSATRSPSTPAPAATCGRHSTTRRRAWKRRCARRSTARALARHAQTIDAELDGRPLALVPMTGGATDAAFAGRSRKAAVVESFGLAGFGYHARDEYVELDSIAPRLYLVARLLQDIGSGKAPR
jgi:glutamate carboxypeptidase